MKTDNFFSQHFWWSRLIMIIIGVTTGVILMEGIIRLSWEQIVSKYGYEYPLRTGESLGEALRTESLSYIRWVSNDISENGLFEPDSVLGVRMRPNIQIEREFAYNQGTNRFTVNTDRYGMRGPDREPPPVDALKVLVIGDSMTFGVGVPNNETYPARLETLLSSRFAPREVRVYNAGVVAYGPYEELAALREFVPKLHPDLIIFQFTVLNDVIETQRWLSGSPLVADPNGASELANNVLLNNPIAKLSYLYRFSVWHWGRHIVKYNYMEQSQQLDRTANIIIDARQASLTTDGRLLPFLLLVAPSSTQVENNIIDKLIGTTRINQGIAKRLEVKKIPILDPLQTLIQYQVEGEHLYIPTDRHWTALGNQRVAEMLVPVLENLLSSDN